MSGLTASELEAYRSQGFVMRRGVLDAGEVDALHAECDRLWTLPEVAELDEQRTRKTRQQVPDERVTDRIDPVLDISPAFTELSTDERIVAPVRDVLREEPILFKDKVIAKPPGMRGYDLHQDFAYWDVGLPPDAVVTALVAIDAADRENGALEIFAGYSDRILTPDKKDVDEADVDPASAVHVETQPGDLCLFHPLAPHRSGRNDSDRTRRQLYITYSAASYGSRYGAYYDGDLT